jgi:hypothetical protein
VQLPNGRFALAPHLFLKFVYQQYDIKSSTARWHFQVLRCGGGSFGDGIQGEGKSSASAEAGFSQNAFRDLFPKTVRDAIAAWISSADFFVVEGRLWGPLENAASIISLRRECLDQSIHTMALMKRLGEVSTHI